MTGLGHLASCFASCLSFLAHFPQASTNAVFVLLALEGMPGTTCGVKL